LTESVSQPVKAALVANLLVALVKLLVAGYSRSSAVMAEAVHSTVALLGVVTALLGVSLTYLTKDEFFDAAAAIAIGVGLAVYGMILAFESKDLLIGEGIGKHDMAEIGRILKGFPQVVSVIDVRGIYFGPEDVVLGLEVEFQDDLRTEELEAAVDKIEKAIRNLSPRYHHIYVEAEKPDQEAAA
jgi:cation diffusion facilitator family transporter